MSKADDKESDRKRSGSRKSRWDEGNQSGKLEERKRNLSTDPSSEEFDPLEALYSSNVPLPDPKAPTYDNLSKFESIIEGRASTSKPKPIVTRVTYEDLPPRDLTDTYDNVKKWMKEVTGPLKVLRDCMERKIKVKVTTRSAAAVRGQVTGYISAFDKLWNLAIEDATEIWTRKKKKKIPALDGVTSFIPPRTAELRMVTPAIKVTRVDKKTERCERKVGKMIVRGEHIVIISTIDL